MAIDCPTGTKRSPLLRFADIYALKQTSAAGNLPKDPKHYVTDPAEKTDNIVRASKIFRRDILTDSYSGDS